MKAKFVKHLECLVCNSSDGNALYADGSTYCFVCGSHSANNTKGVTVENLKVYEGRGITKETAELYKTHLITGGDVAFSYGKGTKIRKVDKEFYWQGVNTAGLFGQDIFKEGKFKTVVVTEGECLLPSTKVLTRNGWVTLEDYTEEHGEVMQANGEFAKPIAKIYKDYDAKMLAYQSGSYKLDLTPDHNMIRQGNSGHIKVKASDKTQWHKNVPRVVNFDSNADDLNARIQVMLSADFTFKEAGDIYGSFKKQRKIERAKMLLDKAGVRYNLSVNSKGYSSFFIHRGHGLNVSKLFKYERDLNSAKTIIDELVHWDGNTVPERNQIEYASVLRSNAEFIQTCAHLCGYVSSIISRKRDKYSWYKVSILLGKTNSSTQQGFTEYEYKGKVACLTMPDGTLLVKQGDSISVTGNCDAMSAYQILGGTTACVSVENGASGALNSFKKYYKWLDSFEKIVIAFDGDAPGIAAAKECATIFSHKSYILNHKEYKDANEYLQNNRSALWLEEYKLAKKYVPDSIVTVKDILDDVLKEPEEGTPWAFESLTALTHGRRKGELYGFGAGVGMGKTDVFTQMITYDLIQLQQPVGVFYLEQPQRETALRIAGKMDSKVYHTDATKEQWEPTIRKLADMPLYLFKHVGAKDWETIKSHIVYLVKALDVKLIYLDHLTALVSDAKDERRTLDSVMADMASVAQENDCIIHFISHLSTPVDGKSHEEGARIRERDFTGSRAIMRWAHYLFGIEGNKNSDNEEERNIRNFRVLKDRYTGQATGKSFQLQYCAETGMLSEVVWQKHNDEEIL